MIQEDFLDAYRNLTYKAVMWIRWSTKFCPNADFYMKIDDDIFLNIFSLVKFLKSTKSAEDHPEIPRIYCAVWNGMKVERNPRSKWFVRPEDYPKENYSRYCSGAAYILTKSILSGMYLQTFRQALFWIDDFYVTGILPKELRAKYTDIRHFYGFHSFGMWSKEQLLNGWCFSIL